MHSYHCESPDLDIKTTSKELFKIPWLRLRISTVSVDSIDDELGFTLIEEVPRCVRLVWEVDQGPIANNTQKASQSTLNDKDPAPSVLRDG